MSEIVKFLNSPSPNIIQDQLFPITELMMWFWSNDEHAQQNYDLNSSDGRRRYLKTFLSSTYPHFFKNQKIFNAPSEGNGVNVIGYFHDPSGVGEDSRTTAKSLSLSDISLSILPISLGSRDDLSLSKNYSKYFDEEAPYDVNIFNLTSTSEFSLIRDLGIDIFKSRYNIGFWPWELETWPHEWIDHLKLNDEIWAISNFVKDSLSSVTDKNVLTMPLTVELPPLSEEGKANLVSRNIKPEACKFLFMFDALSFTSRKNPEAVVRSFKKAFPSEGTENVSLVVKVLNMDVKSSFWTNFLDLIGNDERITLITEKFSKSMVTNLVKSCDCFVSLHRSEGFGRGIAEAMLMGKPCIVTAYSGNMDYCTEENSYLVDYDLIPVGRDQYPGVSSSTRWACPSIEHAASHMKSIFGNKEKAKAVGAVARETIISKYSPDVTKNIYLKRLKEIFSLVNNGRE